MKVRVCRFCREPIFPGRPVLNAHVCADCQRLLEDDSPLRAAFFLTGFPGLAPPKQVPHPPANPPDKRGCPLRHGRFRKLSFLD